MGTVVSYQTNHKAQARWSKMDTTEEVVSRFNGLPITARALAAELFDRAPSEYCPPSEPA